MPSTCVQYVNNQCTEPSKKCVRLSTGNPIYLAKWVKVCAQCTTFAQITHNWRTGFSTIKSAAPPLFIRQLYPLSTAPIITKTK